MLPSIYHFRSVWDQGIVSPMRKMLLTKTEIFHYNRCKLCCNTGLEPTTNKRGAISK